VLYLVTSIDENGQATASVHDAIDEEYAAMTYGLDNADVYVCDLSMLTAYRKRSQPMLDRVEAKETASATVMTPADEPMS
jgi:hypothetical protein